MPASVPNAFGDKFDKCPPGHLYRLYWSGWWTTNLENGGLARAQQIPDPRGREREINACQERLAANVHLGTTDNEQLDSALGAAAGPHAVQTCEESSAALLRRRRALAQSGGDVLEITARTTSPFLTGTGTEHPNEVGFTFLEPHGIPFLPGSSVKGALRKAAEELALVESDPRGWTLSDVWYFFGYDATSDHTLPDGRPLSTLEGELAWLRTFAEPALQGRTFSRFLDDLAAPPERQPNRDRLIIHYRGALWCWDALFSIVANSLCVDILNPHHGGYFRGDNAPGDFEKPVPVKFLTVRPGVVADFSFQFRSLPGSRSPGACDERWRHLVTAAFEHAGRWTGFGAKTSVGYGRFERTGPASTGDQAATLHGGLALPSATTAGHASAVVTRAGDARPATRPAAREETWSGVTVTRRPNDGALLVQKPGGPRAEARGARAAELMASLEAAAAERLKSRRAVTNAVVRVCRDGNETTILTIEVPNP